MFKVCQVNSFAFPKCQLEMPLHINVTQSKSCFIDSFGKIEKRIFSYFPLIQGIIMKFKGKTFTGKYEWDIWRHIKKPGN